MKSLRNQISILIILALAALFLNLPEVPNVFGSLTCKACTSTHPYLSLIGAGYFALLGAITLLFPTFPSPLVARGGLTWAVLLALSLTYLHLPNWCVACLIAHFCNILIWTIWLASPPQENEKPALNFKERLCLTLFAPVSVITLFSCLNLTLIIYHFKEDQNPSPTSLKVGDEMPLFTAQIHNGLSITPADSARSSGFIINFIAPNCPYCREQLPIVNSVAAQMAQSSYRFIHVSPSILPEWLQQPSAIEWIEDKEGRLRELFKVSGYPVLFVIGKDGKIAQVIAGFQNVSRKTYFKILSKKINLFPP